MTKSILFQQLDTNCYCELVTNVIYDNFQDILVPMQYFREYKKFIKSTSIHFNCSFMQLKQQNLWSQHFLELHLVTVSEFFAICC